MDTTVIIVAFGVAALDLRWVPTLAPVIVVHNDDRLSPTACNHPFVRHLHPERNIGFGAAVNLAVAEVNTARVVLVNPDATLEAAHWDALAGGRSEVVTVPLSNERGEPTSVIAPYWTPLALATTALRGGARLAPLGTKRRSVLSRILGGWSASQVETLSNSNTGAGGRWPLAERWVSGAVVSIDTERFRSVNGFDERYFLYFEDTDLCRRLSSRYEDMEAVQADVRPGLHGVGGSVTDESTSAAVAAIRRRSAVRYANTQSELSWWPLKQLGRFAR